MVQDRSKAAMSEAGIPFTFADSINTVEAPGSFTGLGVARVQVSFDGNIVKVCDIELDQPNFTLETMASTLRAWIKSGWEKSQE